METLPQENVTTKQRYTRVDEYKDLLPIFREYYLSHRKLGWSKRELMSNFRIDITEPLDRIFLPPSQEVDKFIKKWEREIYVEQQRKKLEKTDAITLAAHPTDSLLPPSTLTDPEAVKVEVKRRDIEESLKTLSEMLVEDATKVIQNADDDVDDELLVKKKNYALNVARHLIAGVQKDKLIALKKNADTRDSAHFLMGLMSKAMAGKLSGDELEILDAVKVQDTKDE